MIGKTIGNLRIVKELGKGGMGVVYLAEHMRLDKKFAVKSLSPELTQEPLFRERFYHEAKNQSQLDHLNIVQVTDFFEKYDQFFLVMEFVDGVTLSDLIERNGPFSQEEAFPILKDILAGLGFAHGKGIIHRDIKPANIILSRDGRARIMDFGIAILAGEKRLTGTGRNIGSPWYMSPEQISRPKEIDQRSDIYALGVLMFEMFTGQVPFEGDTEFSVQNQHINSPPPDPHTLNSSIGEGCRQIILRAMEKDPDRRFQSCAEFLQAIKACENSPSLRAADVQSSEFPKPQKRVTHATVPMESQGRGQRKKPFIIAGIIALIMAIAGIVFFNPTSQRQTVTTTPTAPTAKDEQAPVAKPSMAAPEPLTNNISSVDTDTSGQKDEKSPPTPVPLTNQDTPKTPLVIPKDIVRVPAKTRTADSGKTGHKGKPDNKEVEEPVKKTSPVQKIPNRRESLDMIPVKVFQDPLENGTDGPGMVVVPEGNFPMGPFWDDGEDDNKPSHRVFINRPFALGKYELTFAEYDLFAKATGRGLPSDEGWGRGRRPVINVSWHDAAAYTEWLSQQTGKHYRLPTEAEWEYAARSRGKDETWAGTSDPEELGDYAWNNADSDQESHPVGTKKPNRLNLYDMNGNVAEWVEDCWNRGYFNAPDDGSSWLTGDCGQRVIRGGSFNDKAEDMPLVFRRSLSSEIKKNNIGFRIARDI